MRKALPFILFFALLAMIVGSTSVGCGGGGGGGSNGGSGGSFTLYPPSVTVGTNGRVYLHAVLNGVPAITTWDATSGVVTPIGTGSAYWEGFGTASVTITATSGTKTDTTIISIDDTKASVYGRILDSGTFNGINGAIIDFKQGTTNVGNATALPNGYFMAAIPATSTRFHVRSNSISNAFYKQYTYNSLRYTMLSSTCTAPLPSLAVGFASPLVSNVVVAVNSGPPPPPPNGCQ